MSLDPTKLTARSPDGRGSRRPSPCRRARPAGCPRVARLRGTAPPAAPAPTGRARDGFRMNALPVAIATPRHPERDHRRKIERGDPRADAQRLTHRIDVDPRPGALGVFALQHVRDAAAEFDDLQPALDVALAVGDHLAVLARAEQVRQLVHIRLDQRLEVEHDARPALRVGRRPAGLRRLRRGHRAVEVGLRAQRHRRLHLAGIRIVHVAAATAASAAPPHWCPTMKWSMIRMGSLRGRSLPGP